MTKLTPDVKVITKISILIKGNTMEDKYNKLEIDYCAIYDLLKTMQYALTTCRATSIECENLLMLQKIIVKKADDFFSRIEDLAPFVYK